MKTKHKILFAKTIFFFLSKFKSKNKKVLRNKLKRIKNIYKYISSISDGESTTLIAK